MSEAQNKAYILDADCDYNVLVYAPTRNKARAVGLDGYEYIETTARRAPEADKWANEGKVFEEIPSRLRDLGWWCDDQGYLGCNQCGLHDWSRGENKDWVVCDWCNQCGGCGHDEECREASRAIRPTPDNTIEGNSN